MTVRFVREGRTAARKDVQGGLRTGHARGIVGDDHHIPVEAGAMPVVFTASEVLYVAAGCSSGCAGAPSVFHW